MSEPIHVRIEAAHAVAQALRQHWDDAVGQVNAVPALVGFAVEGAAGFHIGRDISDVHAQPPAAALDPFHIDRVVEIPRVIRIDRDDEFAAQIFAALEHLLGDGFRDPLRFLHRPLSEIRSANDISE